MSTVRTGRVGAGRATGSPRVGATASARGAGRQASGRTGTGGLDSGRTSRVARPPQEEEEPAPAGVVAEVGGGLSRGNSKDDFKRDGRALEAAGGQHEDRGGLFHIIEQLAALEATLWCILDGLKSSAPHVSFFCREYWGSSASRAQLSLERLGFNERLKRQVVQAGVLESMSLAVAAHLCSGVMEGVSVTVRSRLRNLLYYIHENCLVLLDLICQRWLVENPNRWAQSDQSGHCPENLNLDILVRVKRYRCLRMGEHVMALRQHNDMIANVVRQLCRGATARRPASSASAATSRRAGSGALSPTGRGGTRSPTSSGGPNLGGVLAEVNELVQARVPLDRLKPSAVRSKMLANIRFSALLNVDGEEDCPWPTEDPYTRYGSEQFAQTGPVIWFAPLPPMYPNLEGRPSLLPPLERDTLTLVLDLDETLVHYHEMNGQGTYDIRPGAQEFLHKMNSLGYEVVIFTAATQDYADWVIDQIDPTGMIHHRCYRQHALPWGPIFVKDLSRLGRDLDKTLIIDNIQENFMLQPHHGIFIFTWYDDPNDTALFALTPLLDELISTRVRVPEILDKYQDQIPSWAGFDAYSQLDYGMEDQGLEEDYGQDFADTEQQELPLPQVGLPSVAQQGPGFSPAPREQPQPALQSPGGTFHVEATVVSGPGVERAAAPQTSPALQVSHAQAVAPRFAGGPCQAPPPQQQAPPPQQQAPPPQQQAAVRPAAPRFAGGPCQAPPPGQPGVATPGTAGVVRMPATAAAPAFAAGVGPYQAPRLVAPATAGAPCYGRAAPGVGTPGALPRR